MLRTRPRRRERHELLPSRRSSTGPPSGSTPPSGSRRCSATRSAGRRRPIGSSRRWCKSDPKNYRVYLERGRYRRRFDLKGAEDDFQKSLELAPDQPETYLEAAQLAERKSGLDAARQVLDKGLEEAPGRPSCTWPWRTSSGGPGGWIGRSRSWRTPSRRCPSRSRSAMQLALILAASGDTGKLYLQIQEMKDSGVNQVLIDYFMAYYHVNKNEFARARQILASLQPVVAHLGDFKSRVNVLLARCYGQLGEPELQWDASQRAVAANPDDLQAKLDWIQGMVNRGDLDGAIEQYQRIVAQVPQVRLRLVRLLIAQNRQRRRASATGARSIGCSTRRPRPRRRPPSRSSCGRYCSRSRTSSPRRWTP